MYVDSYSERSELLFDVYRKMLRLYHLLIVCIISMCAVNSFLFKLAQHFNEGRFEPSWTPEGEYINCHLYCDWTDNNVHSRNSVRNVFKIEVYFTQITYLFY